MSFTHWLRHNAESSLLRDAQRRMAEQHHANAPARPRGLAERWWLQVFAPVYRFLPWRLRRVVMQQIPGSHRMGWPAPQYVDPEQID
ncbi:hypothetical protein KM427_05370 [Nocardioides sp. LMS-CY]|uniref:hypothetical protein n=1 Tax=Nocardioides sp. (strain LMS-CY) TaxID=2840457 RepID=UPI001C002163|nr:hypothetical protein [Nocardioides sp. LMS-CY]QWF23154.1 hypothetical protein KM427_05370 [Nocardioides sp. LMS-CY]